MRARSVATALVIAAVLMTVGGVLFSARVAGRPMAIDDLIGAVRVADPQLSPDGKTVVYVRTTTDLKTGKRNADIWRVAMDGASEPKPLITGDMSDTTPRFLPDGRLVFVSSRDGTPPVYLAGADGGNVTRVTSLTMGVQPPLIVSADGSRMAFVSDVYPECADEVCNTRRHDEADANPVKVHRLTRLLYRHWDEWREGVRHHVFTTDLTSGRSIDLTPGDFDSPPAQQEDGAIAFSPDGREIAFASNREGGDREAWTTNHDIWTVPVTGGEAKRRTPNPASDLQPAYSPDGRTIFVRAQRRPGFESDRWYLDAYDRSTGVKRTVATGVDVSIDDYALSKDGADIWFTASQEGRECLFEVPAAGGTARRIGGTGVISDIRPGDGGVVFLQSSMTAPAEVFRLSTPILGHTNRFRAAITHDGVFNLESMTLATEELWFTDWEFGGPPWDAKARAQFAKWSPHLFASQIKTPTLIITNELDYRVPVDQGLQMFTALRRNGVPSEALVFPDEGHWVLKALNSRVWHEAVFGWLKQYLNGPGA